MTLTLGLSGTNFLRGYERSMKRNPLATKMATCAVGFGAGDIVAQAVSRKPPMQAAGVPMPERPFVESLDLGRVMRMALFGGVVAAPQMHLFFNWLDKVVMPLTPKHPIAVLSKVCIDQIVNSPLGTMIFFTWTQTLKGQPQNAVPEITEKLWPTTQASWRLWPAAQAVNFLMVPVHLRIVFINVVAILWTTILSRIGN